MDQEHITMIGNYPVFMTHTRGVAGDSPKFVNNIESIREDEC